MLKIVGATMVVAASGFGGMAVAGNYSRRPKELKSMRSALQMLETEISYGATHLPEALRRVAKRCDGTAPQIFGQAAAELSRMSGITAGEAWKKSLESYYPGSALRPRDFSILSNLGSCLGISDRKDQVKHLRLAMEQIGLEIKSAEEEASRNVKLWSYLGFLCGIMVVLVLC